MDFFTVLVVDAEKAVLEVGHIDYAVSLLMQTELRDRLCQKNFTECLEQRSEIGIEIRERVAEATEKWGVEIERVQMKNIDLVNLS